MIYKQLIIMSNFVEGSSESLVIAEGNQDF